jgi:bifunctional UDP-N-acetylglucosamine pyrophosphorylase/glucosamine-1-phosphate N-acetyltransferase
MPAVSAPLVQAVVIAAGQGTRTRQSGAKVLLPVLGVPLLEHVLRELEVVGADPTVVVVGHQAEAVEKAFAGRGLTFVRQEPRRGTGHAVQAAERILEQGRDRTALVVNGDLPFLRASTLTAVLERHREAGAAATLLTAILPDSGAYGRVVRDGRSRIQRIVEARDASPEELKGAEINVGVYAFAVPVLLDALQKLTPQNAQGELYLTDVVGHLAQAGQRVEAVRTEEPMEALGVNTLAELAEASRRLRQRRLDELMAAGVFVEDPATTAVGLDVVVEPEATLRAFTLLEGRTVVRAGARIGPFVRLADTEVGPGAQILDHCLLRECVVEAGASVGPFTHIRPESRIGAGARVGNFVEMKKADLGQGSKASHLSYLGDATIGPGVNIGAGTITCNYDGATKHVTRIEAGAFVGSDTVLVAPVTVGEGAYVAAGSAITEDVPAQALALGRARQVNKPGWAAKRRRGGER